MSRPSPIFFLALGAIVLTASSGAAISVSLREPQEVSPWWFLQRVDSALNPDDDGVPPVIFNVHIAPEIMKQGDPNVAGVEISAWVRDDGAVETVYAEVGGRYVPLIDLTRSGRYDGRCSSHLPTGDHRIAIVAVDRAGNAARCDELVLRVLDPLDLNSNRIEDSLEEREDQDLRVIILVEENVSLKGRELVARDKVEEFKVVPGASMVIPGDELENLARTEGVRGVYEDKKLTVLGEVWEGYSPRNDPRLKVSEYNGSGITVAVLDTGADPNHHSLDDMDDDIFTNDSPKIIAFKDFVNGEEETYDDHGHGTHCASLIAGTGDQGGVAPGANLVVIKVMDKDGACFMSDAITALDWILENQDDLGIDVISFSVGGEGPSDGSTPLDAVCDKMVDDGIVMCVGAGNAGPDARSIVTPGTARKVITVGAIDANGGIYRRSSRGPSPSNDPKPDLVAVGVNVTSARAGTLREDSTMSGTSMAAPQVAGAAAVILEKESSLEPAEVKRVLSNSADDIGPIDFDNTYGHGVLNLSKALSLVEESKPEISSLTLSKYEARVGDHIYVEATIPGNIINMEDVYVLMHIGDVEIEMNDVDKNGLYSHRLMTNLLAPGSYTVQVELKDKFSDLDTVASTFVLI